MLRKAKRLFSTHVLDTAQQLCDQLAILKKGELLYNGSVDELLAQNPDLSFGSDLFKNDR